MCTSVAGHKAELLQSDARQPQKTAITGHFYIKQFIEYY